jgi:hypothetical protein
MAIFRFKGRMPIRKAFLIGVLATGVGTVSAEKADSLVDSFCFVPSYGGYKYEGIQSDGNVRLSAQAVSYGPGTLWSIELLVPLTEIRQIWVNAVTEKLSQVDLDALLVHCNAKNSALETALKKASFNRYVESRPSWDRMNKQAGVPLPASAIPDKATFTVAEETAIAAWRNDATAAAASERLKGVTWVVFQAFLSISQGRARHFPYVQKPESPSDLSRRFLGLPPTSK